MQSDLFQLSWLDPRDGSRLPAGVSFYNHEFGEYLLKIDEEPLEKQYFLKPVESGEGKISYRMDLVIKRRDGKFLKRQKVGEGYSSDQTSGEAHIKFGSKFKTLVISFGGK